MSQRPERKRRCIPNALSGEQSRRNQTCVSLPRLPELDDHNHLTAIPRGGSHATSTGLLQPVSTTPETSNSVMDDIVRDTCLVVSVSNKDRARILRLHDFNDAKALQIGLFELYDLTTELVDSVSVLYRWWSKKALEFHLDNESDYGFLLERVRKFDGSKGNCVVELYITLKQSVDNAN